MDSPAFGPGLHGPGFDSPVFGPGLHGPGFDSPAFGPGPRRPKTSKMGLALALALSPLPFIHFYYVARVLHFFHELHFYYVPTAIGDKKNH